MGNGCGSVGRSVASNTRGLQFKSSYLTYRYTVNCIETTKIKKKRPGMAQLFRNHSVIFTYRGGNHPAIWCNKNVPKSSIIVLWPILHISAMKIVNYDASLVPIVPNIICESINKIGHWSLLWVCPVESVRHNIQIFRKVCLSNKGTWNIWITFK